MWYHQKILICIHLVNYAYFYGKYVHFFLLLRLLLCQEVVQKETVEFLCSFVTEYEKKIIFLIIQYFWGNFPYFSIISSVKTKSVTCIFFLLILFVGQWPMNQRKKIASSKYFWWVYRVISAKKCFFSVELYRYLWTIVCILLWKKDFYVNNLIDIH